MRSSNQESDNAMKAAASYIEGGPEEFVYLFWLRQNFMFHFENSPESQVNSEQNAANNWDEQRRVL